MTLDEILNGETDRVEFKVELPKNTTKYTKSVVAFANSSGGRIVVGVEDETCRIVGVDKTQISMLCDSIANAISDSCAPQILPDIEPVVVDGKDVLVVTVFPGPNRPYFITSLGKEKGVFIRVNRTTRLADAAIIKDLEMQGASASFDEIACVSTEYDENAAKKLCRDIERYIFEADNVKKSVGTSQLERWCLLKRVDRRLVPTNGFMLLTKNPFRYAKIQCGLFKGTTRSVFIDRREFDGPLHEQIEEAYNFVLKHIRLGAVIDGLVRKDVYELPTDSIREVIVNAVTHRNYLENSCVQVAVYDDRVEVTSPGMLYGGITLEMILSGTSNVRNKAIAEIFSQMRIIENWGTAVQRIIDGCREYGIAAPEFIELGTAFRVNLYRTQAALRPEQREVFLGAPNDPNRDPNDPNRDRDDPNKASGVAGLLLRLVKENPAATYNQLASQTEVSSATVKREMRKLKEAGLIRRVGSTRGRWEAVDAK